VAPVAAHPPAAVALAHRVLLLLLAAGQIDHPLVLEAAAVVQLQLNQTHQQRLLLPPLLPVLWL
jgi:hypothetical protein